MVLKGVDEIDWFTDRPDRVAGEWSPKNLVKKWESLFGGVEPNAQATFEIGSKRKLVTFEMFKPKLRDSNQTLIFKVRGIGEKNKDLLTGLKNEQISDASLFIDDSIDKRFIDASPFFTHQRTIKGKTIFRGTVGDDKIHGSTSHDLIIGMRGNDTIRAGAGDDIVYGNHGNDVLYGGKDDDIINGAEGSDTLIGGSGADTFFVNEGMNVIKDFNKDDGDFLKFGRFLSDIRYEQDGDDVLIHSNKGITVALNNNVNDFI